MVTGTVNAKRDAVIKLSVYGKQNQVIEIEAVIDTGYTGFLILPLQMIEMLELTYLAHTESMLANGKMEDFAVYAATVDWDGQKRLIEVDATGADPLIGMSLLDGYELRIQVIPEGLVTIELLNPSL